MKRKTIRSLCVESSAVVRWCLWWRFRVSRCHSSCRIISTLLKVRSRMEKSSVSPRFTLWLTSLAWISLGSLGKVASLLFLVPLFLSGPLHCPPPLKQHRSFYSFLCSVPAPAFWANSWNKLQLDRCLSVGSFTNLRIWSMIRHFWKLSHGVHLKSDLFSFLKVLSFTEGFWRRNNQETRFTAPQSFISSVR